MKHESLQRLAAPALLVVALSGGCDVPRAQPDAPDTVELRTYKVPAGYENQAPSMLRAAFGKDGVGRVSVGPAGSVLVLASASIQRGVAEFIDELAAAGPASAGPAPVVMTYWMVLGIPDPSAGGVATEGHRPLDEIRPALEQIVRGQGPQRFKLLERVQLTSVGEEWAHTIGRLANVRQRATLVHGVVLADIQVSVGPPRIETQVRLEPDQLVVLAQTGVDRRPERAPDSDFPGEDLYYIVSSRIE